MRTRRLRLRFVPGVSTASATYGTSTYGGPITYGQRASDPLVSYRYWIIPLPTGGPTSPAWMYREGDVGPAMEAQVRHVDGTLNLSSVASAQVRLQLLTESVLQPQPITLDLDIASPTSLGVVSHTFDHDQDPDIPAGTYRALFVFTMTSGRRLTLPTDDNLLFVVTAA